MDGEPQNQKRDLLLPGSILVAAILISGSVIYVSGRGAGPSAAPGQPVGAGLTADVSAVLSQSSRDVILGDPKAPVTLIEYGDYQCPFCARFFTDTEPQIRQNYIQTGKVKMVFRNFIVNDRTPQDHESHWSAQAAECAKDQHKFWQFHDAIYSAEAKDGVENNGNLNRAFFVQTAQNLGMDVGQFTACFDGQKYAAQVQAESDEAIKIGVQATPTIFVNGQKIEGALPYASFQSAIDQALAAGGK